MSKKIGEWIRLNYRNIIIGSLVIVPLLVSLISTIHVVNFFKLSNFTWLAVTLAIAFEIGALSSLAALAVMNQISKVSLWLIFILITVMQMMGNTYYAFDFITEKMLTQPQWTQNWIDLFSITNESIPTTKRILAIVSGAILPVISLTFLHLLITYISKTKIQNTEEFDYEEIYVDENGNEIQFITDITNVVQTTESVNVPFVQVDEDIKDLRPNFEITTTVTPDETDGTVEDGFKDRKSNMEPKSRQEVRSEFNEITPMNTHANGNKKTSDKMMSTIIDNSQQSELIEAKSKAQLPNELLPFIGELVKQIKPNATENDVIELKNQIEKIATPGSDGKFQIDLAKFITNKPNLSATPPSGVYNLEPPELMVDKKKDNPYVRAVDSETIIPTVQIPKQESHNVIQHVPNNIPNTTASVGIGKPFRIPSRAQETMPKINASGNNNVHITSSSKSITDIPIKNESQTEILPVENLTESIMVMDTTFEANTSIASNVETETVGPIEVLPKTEPGIENNSLDALKKATTPVKKKILLYKGKKKLIYDGYI